MKFLHTADLHIKKGEKNRIEILQWLINKAEAMQVDFFIIAGDLFESDTDAIILRQEIKSIFRASSCKFLIIPGNHDLKSYSHDYDYGDNVIQLIETPFEIIELNNLKVCGVPYQNKRFSECIKNIPENIDILTAHGTLYDESFIFSMLDDKETKYMPIYPANLENIARYVAMGHLHSKSIEKRYKNTHVVYPGSPIALDTKCIDKRCCYIIVISKEQFKFERLDIEISPYWQKKEFFVFPGNEEYILKNIDSYLSGINEKHMMPQIIINGFIGEKDNVFKNRITEISRNFLNKFQNLKTDVQIESWDKIIQNRMVKTFVQKTMNLDNTLRMKIFEISFPIFSKVLK